MTTQPTHRPQPPFAAGLDGATHLWVWHDIQVTPAVEIQDLVHDHKHANGLANHAHTVQPEAVTG